MKNRVVNFLIVSCFGFITINAVKFLTLGDSTMENDGCVSDLLGLPFPPSPPYSTLNRFSSDLHWVDYFQDVYDVDVISCACGTSLASGDTIFNPFENATTATIPGLVSQIDICLQQKGLAQELETDDEIVAIIQSGGNDILNVIFSPGSAPVTPQDFAAGFEQAIKKLTEIGVKQIFIASTIIEVENPRETFNRENFPALVPFFTQLADGLQNAFYDVLARLLDEGFPVVQIPINELILDVRAEADQQGINSLDSCIDPGSPWGALEILPDCTEFNRRMFFDSVHFADWGHQQYAKQMGKFLEEQGVLEKVSADDIDMEILTPSTEAFL